MRGDKRIRQQNIAGNHRAMFVKGTDDRAIAIKYEGTMVFTNKEGVFLTKDEVELRPTGIVSHSRGN